MPDNIITNRQKFLDPTYVAFLQSPFSENLAEVLGKKLSFTEDQQRVFENAIDLYLHFFLDKTTLTDFIETECHLDSTTSSSLVDAVILSLPEHFENHQAASYKVFSTPTPSSKPKTPTTNQSTTENTTIPTIRTMEQDAAIAQQTPATAPTPPPTLTPLPAPAPTPAPEATHTSSQADLLTKTPPAPDLAATPTSTVDQGTPQTNPPIAVPKPPTLEHRPDEERWSGG